MSEDDYAHVRGERDFKDMPWYQRWMAYGTAAALAYGVVRVILALVLGWD